MDDFFNFNFDGDDELNEFNKFNKQGDISRMFNERMNDDEFRERFNKIVGNYQRDFEKMLRLLYNNKKPLDNPFSGLSPDFNGLDLKSLTKDGWDEQHWTSPDGKTQISSFSRSMTPEDFYYNEKRRKMNGDEISNKDLIELLEYELGEAVSEEKYEKAAKLRDTIKELKEGE
jgi:hypothetical protein